MLYWHLTIMLSIHMWGKPMPTPRLETNPVHLTAPRRRYQTDLSDAAWDVVAPLVDTPQTGSGPRRSVNLREVVNAILYKQYTGCQWRMLPNDFPPRSTVSGYFQRWKKNGVWDQVIAALQDRAQDIEYQNRTALLTKARTQHKNQ
jgi:transposase